jgi:excisionase family DNA binding protein
MPSDTSMTPKLLLTPRETAALLSVSERHLHTLTKRDSLPCVRLGKCVRYLLSDIERWIAERAGPAGNEMGR